MLKFRRRPPRVGHARRAINDEVRLEISFFFIFFDEVTIGLTERPPVDMPDLVARAVLPMLGELDGEPLKRALVQPRHDPFDDESRQQFQPAKFRQGRRVHRRFRSRLSRVVVGQGSPAGVWGGWAVRFDVRRFGPAMQASDRIERLRPFVNSDSLGGSAKQRPYPFCFGITKSMPSCLFNLQQKGSSRVGNPS